MGTRMRPLFAVIAALLIAGFAQSNTLRDEIELEKAKLLSYTEAMLLSEKEKKPIVVCVGCHVDNVDLFNSLKGKVILCYLQANGHPFAELQEGVVVGHWTTKDSKPLCQRYNVAAKLFKDPNQQAYYLDFLKPKTLPAQYQLDCPDGKCYAPASGGYLLNSYCPTCPQQRR
jgi:hypothetical protein